jgi:hypothetical protein
MRRGLTLLGLVACAVLCAACSSDGPTTRAVAPAHVETWAYVDSCHGVSQRQTELVRHWVTYAETKCAGADPIAPAACRTGARSYCVAISYLDPNLDWSRAGLGLTVPSCVRTDRRGCANEDWFVHDARTGRRLTWTASNLGSAWLLDGGDPSLDRFIVGFADRALARFRGLMVDDVGASTREQLYGNGHPSYASSAELHSDAAVRNAHVRLATELARSFLQIDNGLNVNPNNLPAFDLLDHPAAVVGLVSEGYPEDADNTLASWYSTGLDDIAYLENTPRLARNFIALLGYNSSGSMAARRVQEATVMLGFEPGRIVDWADLAQTKPGLAVWPEEGLYFEQPLETMRVPSGPRCMNGLGGPCVQGHADLQVARGTNLHEQTGGAGVYRREFRRCFLRGAPIGGCAAIVNDTDRAITISSSWLRGQYRHAITMAGGSVADGGRLKLDGADFTPGVTTIAADDAALLTE